MSDTRRRGRAPTIVGTRGECPTPAKHWYISRKKAKDALRSALARGAYPGLAAYKCRCGFFHITSKDAAYRESIREYERPTPPEAQ